MNRAMTFQLAIGLLGAVAGSLLAGYLLAPKRTVEDMRIGEAERYEQIQNERRTQLKADMQGSCETGQVKASRAGFALTCEKGRWVVPGIALN
jgi:hypothetical protein